MITAVLRYLKRFLVLLPVIAVTFVSVFNIFPEFNDKLPLLPALLITYILGAYVLIPAIIRLARIIFPVKHLPHYCVTGDGFASDPLNIAIIGTRQEVAHIMSAAGWRPADKLTPKTALRTAISLLRQRAYLNAPMSRLYLFGRKQDLAYQLPDLENGSDSRHHVRFWASTYKKGNKLNVQSIDWRSRDAHIRNDRLLWLGAASRDVGITVIRHSGQLTHLVDSDTNAERELLAKDILKTKLATLHRTIKLTEPYHLLNVHALSGHIKTDARMKVFEVTKD
jgi:hypothetical protein